MIKKVCYFGYFDPEYSRNRVLRQGLKENGVEIVDCRSREKGIRKYYELYNKHKKIKKDGYDVLLVGFPGHLAAILARFLTRKKIIFDCFTSLYDSAVYDRKKAGKISLIAGYYWLLDYLSCRLADTVLLDTNAHIDYFVKTFHLPRSKFIRVFVGTDEKLAARVRERKRSERDRLIIHFHGSYIPLQGVEYILEASKLLLGAPVKFRMIGTRIKNRFGGGDYPNVEFLDNVPYAELFDYIADADICLGIFGDTEKAKRVIPNKVFEAIAVGRPVITADTPAIRELLSDNENVILCRLADPKDLVEKVKMLVENYEFRDCVAKRGLNVFLKMLNAKNIVNLFL